MLGAVAFAPDHDVTQRFLQLLQGSAERVRVQPDMLAFLALFLAHVTRRLLESLLVTQFGAARMHAGVFAVGCAHYVAAPLSALSDPAAVEPHDDSQSRLALLALGVALYAVASYHQSLCNALIARQKRANGMKHVLPRGDWFDAVRCPLYSADILLYVSFLLVTGGANAMLYATLAWVVINQTLLAKCNADWSAAKFRDADLARLPRWHLFPHVW